MKGHWKILNAIDGVSDRLGKISSLLVFPLIAIIVLSAILRKVAGLSIVWALEVSCYLFFAMWLFGTAYNVLADANVRMDVVYSRLSVRVRAILDAVTAPLFFLFVVMLIWKGWENAWQATMVMQHSYGTAWRAPIYIIKWLIPFGGFFMLLQGLAIFTRNLMTAIGRGRLP